jgi:hypothetical protein
MSIQTCCHDIRTDATLNCSNVLEADGCLDSITTSSGQMLLSDERLDALLSRPDGNKIFDFSELESAQNLP